MEKISGLRLEIIFKNRYIINFESPIENLCNPHNHILYFLQYINIQQSVFMLITAKENHDHEISFGN